jgi:hemolysin-activating ACP:hemolysin acyltransferase
MSDTAAMTAPADQGKAARRAVRSLKYAATLGQIVSVMMRTPQHRQTFLADLDWLVLPAIATNQYALNEVTDDATGATLPVAVALWASVSEEVDRRLSANPTGQIRLKAEEWNSGTIPWLVEAVGEPRATGALLKAILERRFAATGLKSIGRDDQGRTVVRVLKSSEAAAA